MATETSTTKPVTTGQTTQSDPELRRVREIILGDDPVQALSRGAEVERLRKVLFGDQTEEYNRRLADLRRDIDRLQRDMRQVQDSVSEFEKKQVNRVEQIEREMSRMYNEVRRELNQLNSREAALQQLISRSQQQELFGKVLSERADDLHNQHTKHERELLNLRTALSEQREQFERNVASLKRELREAEDELRSELRRVTDRINDQKTDRKALAAMLMEVATRLETGSTVTNLLGTLASSEKPHA